MNGHDKRLVKPVVPGRTDYLRNDKAGVAECLFCHNRAYSRISANIRLWEGVHAKYCTQRGPERGKIDATGA
jgi:hypothetical protein